MLEYNSVEEKLKVKFKPQIRELIANIYELNNLIIKKMPTWLIVTE